MPRVSAMWLSAMWPCRLTQRKDFSYEGYRWQPESCEMPEFERSAFLRRSVSLLLIIWNFPSSLLCLVYHMAFIIQFKELFNGLGIIYLISYLLDFLFFLFWQNPDLSTEFTLLQASMSNIVDFFNFQIASILVWNQILNWC